MITPVNTKRIHDRIRRILTDLNHCDKEQLSRRVPCRCWLTDCLWILSVL